MFMLPDLLQGEVESSIRPNIVRNSCFFDGWKLFSEALTFGNESSEEFTELFWRLCHVLRSIKKCPNNFLIKKISLLTKHQLLLLMRLNLQLDFSQVTAWYKLIVFRGTKQSIISSFTITQIQSKTYHQKKQ